MSKRSPKSVEEKCEILQLYLSHKQSLSQLTKTYQVSDYTIRHWMKRYESDGVDGLREKHTWKRYSKALKEQAVQDYLDGKESTYDICQRYEISSRSVLSRWIKEYTSSKGLKATSKGYSRMKQGRNTTFEERVEIVNYTIAHDKDYQAAVETFGVSYQQVYSWVRKFEKNGSQGLLDRRGKGLDSKPHLTEAEELQLKIKQQEERIKYLEMEVGLLKKIGRHPTEKPSVRCGKHLDKFQAIKDYQEENLLASIQTLCSILKVSRSGYYKWLNHKETTSEIENKKLLEQIKKRHHSHKGILGYRRMTTFINRQCNTNYNKKRIRRLMRIVGISAVIRRVRQSCTKAGDQFYEENILNRDFTATAPNQKWCTDVTYLQYGLGAKAYLSAIKDLYDGSIIAYEISRNNDYPLVMKTIKKALALNPGATPLVHSDRGSQYTSKAYRYFARQAGLTLSMSRVGKCIDNAPIESFFGHFKTEAYHLKKYKTYDELVTDIEHYIEFYNTRRYQTKLNNLTPIEFRNQVA
ncbi:IS3 family transposase [Streptococcus sp. VEG1o]|uniref:IS3 family transposase n=1 Tax=unclassified Streptococcus TaxID=2608887 RepID=UPI00397A4FEA